MRVSRYIYPSFDMKVEKHDPDSYIYLTGENNWKILIATYSIATLVLILLTISIIEYTNLIDVFIFRLVYILFIIAIGVRGYNSIKAARNGRYLKEEIIFDENGITTNHTKKETDRRVFHSKNLTHVKIIFDNGLFKFIIFQLDKPDFEFSIISKPSFDYDKFLANICKILGLEFKKGAQFGYRLIFEFDKKDKLNEINQNNDESLIVDYRPTTFYNYKKDGDLIIKSKFEKERLEIPKKTVVSAKDRKIIYKKIPFINREIKFSEIKSFEYEVSQRSEKNRGKVVIGKLQVLRIDNKKETIFIVDREVNRQQELIEFEILRDLECLKVILEDEMRKRTHT